MKKNDLGPITKSNVFRSALLSGQASISYNKIGTQLECIIVIITSSDADLPILPKTAFAAR